jgi:hypothetical protein
MNDDYGYCIEQLDGAVRSLIGMGSLQERLRHAYAYRILVLHEGVVPPAIRSEVQALQNDIELHFKEEREEETALELAKRIYTLALKVFRESER